MEEY
jgi:hypothetical protein